MLEQGFLFGSPEPLDRVEFGSRHGCRTPLPVVRDCKSVGFVANALKHEQAFGVARKNDGEFVPGNPDFF